MESIATLLLKDRGHVGKHEANNIHRVIRVFLISTLISITCILCWLIMIESLKNILIFLLCENNSQVVVPINKDYSSEFFCQ